MGMAAGSIGGAGGDVPFGPVIRFGIELGSGFEKTNRYCRNFARISFIFPSGICKNFIPST